MRLRGGGEAPEKAIVFSQWTGMLDLVEAAVGRARHRFRRLDGSMSITAREAAIANFQARPHVLDFCVGNTRQHEHMTACEDLRACLHVLSACTSIIRQLQHHCAQGQPAGAPHVVPAPLNFTVRPVLYGNMVLNAHEARPPC